MIIAPSDLTDYVPLYRAPKDGRVTTQFDGPTCEEVGLLKMDFLGLKELSLMDEAARLIRLHQPDFNLDTYLGKIARPLNYLAAVRPSAFFSLNPEVCGSIWIS